MSVLNYFILISHIAAVFSALPPIQKCQLNDSNCLKASAQPLVMEFSKGIPELGTDVLDTMRVDVITVDLLGLKLNVRDADITGLKNSVIDKLSVNTDKKVMELVFRTDIILNGKYKASGKLLILPISGDGDTKIKLKNLEVTMTMPFDIVKDGNGKDIMELKSYKYTYDVKGNGHFLLTNLFNGNKPLSDTMHAFMNNNWKELTKEFGTPMLNKPVGRIFNSIQKYLRSQPFDEIVNA